MDNKHNEELPQLDLNVAIRRVLRGLRQWWFLIIVLAVICGAVSYLQAVRSYRPMYRCEAILSVNITSGEESTGSDSEKYQNIEAANMAAKTFPYVLQSEVMVERLRAELGGGAMGSVSVAPIAESNLLALTVTSAKAETAYNTMQAVITVYPQVNQSILGNTQLIIVREPQMPQEPYNVMSGTASVRSGVTTGALLGLAIAVVLGLMRQTVVSAQDVKGIVNLSCLAKIPKVKVKRRQSGKSMNLVITDSRVDPGFAETFRLLRLRLLRDTKNPDEKVILFTSSVPSEGKSTVAANTALALAKDGKRVLLVDADLRNPSVKGLLDLKSPSVGLGDCLSNASREIKFYRYGETGMYVFAGDHAIKDPTPLLQPSKLAGIFRTLRPMFDYIIVDTPPCLMADAAALCRHADMAVYVVREDWVTRHQIRDGVHALKNAGARISGFVLNQVSHADGGNGYGYGYGYGYSKTKEK